MVQDIKITPSGAGDKIPQMLFTGSGATAINMELNVQPDSRLSYESNEGEVFSISKGLQSGVIFAVKDISGLDQISVNASGDMHLAPYYGAVRVGATGIDPTYKLDVVSHSGVIRASGVKGAISINPDAATITFDLNQATTHGVTLGDNRTLALANATVGDKFFIRLQQDITGSRTVTWFSHIKWAGGGTAPTLTTTAHKADLLDFLAASGDGTNIWYDGFVVGQNI